LLIHTEVELCDIIRASILSLDEMLEDGYSYVQLDTGSLLRRLTDRFRKKSNDIDRLEMDEDGSSENGEEGRDEAMDVD
jgi:septation ring formation regulator EzrA